MIKKDQLTLDYKLSPFYEKKVNQLAIDSKVSFENIETPGWSSIMHTETSPDTSAVKGQLNHHKILEKLNKLNDMDLRQSKFSKVRVPQSTKSNNILIYEQHKHLIQNARKLHTDKENYSERNSLDVKPNNNRMSESNNTHRRVPTANSLKESTLSRKCNKSLAALGKPAVSSDVSVKTVKRFNQITIHEHLYLAGIKQENKRMMERIIDEQYKKEKLMPFQPHINPKSQQLAEIKFSRLKQKSEIEKELEQEMKKSEVVCPKKERQSIVEEREQNRYKVLSKLFYFLSKKGEQITKQTLAEVIEEMPLMCIKTMEKIVEKVYAGKTLTWLEFLGETNDKKTVSNKEGLINVFQKWQSRLDKRWKESTTKQETIRA